MFGNIPRGEAQSPFRPLPGRSLGPAGGPVPPRRSLSDMFGNIPRGTIGRPPMPGETGRSLGPAGGGIRPPMGLGPAGGGIRPPMGSGIGSLQMPYREEAAVDPSDWRTLEAIMGAGGNPDDYVQTAMGPDKYYDSLYGARGGLMSLRR